jgi:hypothetical protein
MPNEQYPLALPIPPKPYRVLLFFAAYGKLVACAAGIAICAIIIFSAGHGAIWLVVGGILAAFTFLMLSCFAELIDLIVDTMLPK